MLIVVAMFYLVGCCTARPAKLGRNFMKTSIKCSWLAFGVAGISAAMIVSASAQVVGGSNCSKIRDMTKGSVGQT